MNEESVALAQVVMGSLGLVILIAYVIATVIIARKAGGQLKLLRDNSDKAGKEFTFRMRPYLCFENLTEDQDQWH